jgi:hypothetical protein
MDCPWNHFHLDVQNIVLKTYQISPQTKVQNQKIAIRLWMKKDKKKGTWKKKPHFLRVCTNPKLIWPSKEQLKDVKFWSFCDFGCEIWKLLWFWMWKFEAFVILDVKFGSFCDFGCEIWKLLWFWMWNFESFVILDVKFWSFCDFGCEIVFNQVSPKPICCYCVCFFGLCLLLPRQEGFIIVFRYSYIEYIV